jgi:hypothetical protein
MEIERKKRKNKEILKSMRLCLQRGGFKKLKDNMGLIQKLPNQGRSPITTGKIQNTEIPTTNLTSFNDKVAFKMLLC